MVERLVLQSSKILQDLLISATGAKAHYDVWWAQVSEAKPKYSRTMNEHSDFFRASQDAHFVATFTYFAHLFDNHVDSSSIGKYLKLISSKTEPVDFARLEDDFNLLHLRAKPLLRIRHKRIAHIDAKLSESDVFSEINITWNEVKQVIYDAAILVKNLNEISSQGSGSIGIPRDGRLSEATLQLFETLCKN